MFYQATPLLVEILNVLPFYCWIEILYWIQSWQFGQFWSFSIQVERRCTRMYCLHRK